MEVFIDGVWITLIGIGIVFGVLIILSASIDVLNRFFGVRETKETIEEEEPCPELVAAMAAVMMVEGLEEERG